MCLFMQVPTPTFLAAAAVALLFCGRHLSLSVMGNEIPIGASPKFFLRGLLAMGNSRQAGSTQGLIFILAFCCCLDSEAFSFQSSSVYTDSSQGHTRRLLKKLF